MAEAINQNLISDSFNKNHKREFNFQRNGQQQTTNTGWVLSSDGELGHRHIHYIQVSRFRLTHTHKSYTVFVSNEP